MDFNPLKLLHEYKLIPYFFPKNLTFTRVYTVVYRTLGEKVRLYLCTHHFCLLFKNLENPEIQEGPIPDQSEFQRSHCM